MDTPSSYLPLILTTIGLVAVVVYSLSYYGRLQSQSWYVTVVSLIGWFSPFWIVFLLPLDLASTRYENCEGTCKVPFALVSQHFLYVAWRTIYWISFCLTWAIIPLLQAYVNAGEFTVAAKFRYAISINLKFYLVYAVVAIVGLVYLIIGNGYTTRDKLQGYVMAMANSWGLLLAIIFMGYGLVAIPRKLWFAANVRKQLKHLYMRAPKVKEECMDSELEYTDIAKTIRKVDHKVRSDDPLLRYAVDQILRRFPAVHDVEMRDTFRSTTIPRHLTEDYLVDLNQRMIKATRMRDRKLALWNNLLRDAFYLQDIVANQDSLDHHFYSTVRPLSEGTTLTDIKIRLEWWWSIRIKPILARALAVLCAIISICVIWSELTFNVRQPVLSIVAVALRACGLNYAAVEVMSFLTLTYMCLCTYTSLFRLKVFNLYLLVPNHHTDENSMLWFTGYLCRMMAPLCYNYLNIAGDSNNPEQEQTVFSKFMGHADLVPFLGTTFIDWFPVVILIPAFAILFNVQGRLLKLCGMPDIYEDDDGEGRHAEDEEGGVRGGRIVLNSEVDEGKALINEERRLREREVDPSSDNRAGGLLSRARNALGTYTAKYNRGQAPHHDNSQAPRSSASALRRDRDRHIDALLSNAFGRQSPIPENSPSPPEEEQSDDSSNALSRIKNRVGKGITDLLNKGSPPQSTSPAAGSSQRGRPVATDTARSLPSSPLIGGRTIRSRSPSPNPWENMHSGGTSMIRGASAAAAYNGRNSKNNQHKNVFDGI
ncbi:LMBR1-like membrane protein-domain-containing protein [Umbelopsis sp. PMI_123]|nr:LMBR1-like membrane protein-domain-containing protein [Umbelopsis sp. PMI_123]